MGSLVKPHLWIASGCGFAFPSCCDLIVAGSARRPDMSSQRLTRPLVSAACKPLARRAPRRYLATPAPGIDDAALPLAGIRVLDMTRVLAGVCVPPGPPTPAVVLTSVPAILYADSGRSRVRMTSLVWPQHCPFALHRTHARPGRKSSRSSIQCAATTLVLGGPLTRLTPRRAASRAPARAHTSSGYGLHAAAIARG